MANYKFSAHAQADLEEIIRYTRKTWGADQANRYIDGLEQRAGQLANTPKLGKPYDNLARGLRSVHYQSHILYYLPTHDGITIVRLLHKRMLPSLHI